MLRQSVKLEINVDTCGKMRELLVLVLCRAQHKQKRTERGSLSPSLHSLSFYHFLFTYLRAMKLSSPLKVCNASGGTAVAGARKLQTTMGCPLPLLPSLSPSSRWTAVNYEQVGHNRNTCRCCCQTFLRPAQLCVAAKVFSCGEINL